MVNFQKFRKIIFGNNLLKLKNNNAISFLKQPAIVHNM